MSSSGELNDYMNVGACTSHTDFYKVASCKSNRLFLGNAIVVFMLVCEMFKQVDLMTFNWD